MDRGVDGWCAFVPVVDGPTREVFDGELDHTARAKTAERALEYALLSRFGTLRGAPEGMKLRHDNGLVFRSRKYRALVADDGLKQEYIASYTCKLPRQADTLKVEFSPVMFLLNTLGGTLPSESWVRSSW